MNNIEIIRRKGQTKFIVRGLKGRLTIHDGGSLIAASVEHQQFLTRVDDVYESYDRMEQCTKKDITDVLIRIAMYVR